MERRLLLLIGCSGTGKSTYASKLDSSWVEINRDNIRADIFLGGNIINMWSRYRHTKQNESIVNERVEIIFHKAILEGKNICISDTNLNIKTRQYWIEIAEKYKYTYSEKIFGLDITVDELLKRDKKRVDKPVGHDTILLQWTKFYQQYGRKYIPDTLLPKAIIVDIDGTIANKSPLRGYYDWSLVSLDTPRQMILDIVGFIYHKYQSHIVFLSGRNYICYDITYNWLLDNIGGNLNMNFSLLMRSDNDNRNDRIVKEELFFNNVAPYYNVIAAIDDRPRVIRLWKDIGIPIVLDVSKSYLEF